MWDSFVQHYFSAYDKALDNSSERREEPREFIRFVEAPGSVSVSLIRYLYGKIFMFRAMSLRN